MADTAIEWADRAWNPIIGCSRVSAGCTRCYAERQAYRCAAMGWSRYDGLTRKVGAEIRWTGEVRLVEEVLDAPLRWRRPRRIFVNSMSDLFHERIPDDWIGRVFSVMGAAKQHIYQILTKRPERMLDFVRQYAAPGGPLGPWPWDHIWLGVSVEDQATADKRIPLLLETPAAVRWVSYEPALGPVDFRRWLPHDTSDPAMSALGSQETPWLNWIVVGGESGPGARPFDIDWARQIIVQCREAGVSVFVKQLGAYPFEFNGDGETWLRGIPPAYRDGSLHYVDRRIKHPKGGAMEEWPADLRVREFPPV